MRSLVAFLSVLIFMAGAAVAGIPQAITYQGCLTDSLGDAVPDGEYGLTLTLYTSPEGDNDIWWCQEQMVQVTGGLFEYQIGGACEISPDIFVEYGSLWLGISVASGPELVPRTKINSVAYAFRAQYADTAAYVASGAAGWINDGSVVRLADIEDSVGIGTTTPSAKLDVVGDMVLSGKATMGPSNTNTGANSFVLGKSNNATGDNATISGGWLNTASGAFQSTVGGGAQNTSSHSAATVGGGQGNTASSLYSTVGGGFYNTADGHSAAISGGYQNAANGDYSFTVGFADSISASGDYSVLFGIGSKLTQDSTFMVDMPHVRIGNETDGFELPTADGTTGQIMTTNGSGQVSWSEPPSGGDGSNWTESGGVLFTTGVYGLARFNSTVWGIDNDSTHINLGVHSTTGAFGFDYKYITISGGYMNNATGDLSTIAGGANNSASDSATISGGYNNTASGSLATIGGGRTNLANGSRATISGGSNNHASGDLPTIGGGYGNYAVDSATVGGGAENTAGGDGATIGGGSFNEAGGYHATIGGGKADTAGGYLATVGGGYLNNAGESYATISGGNFNVASGQFSTIGGGSENEITGNYSTINGGSLNSIIDGVHATISGGNNNDANGSYAAVGGGGANRALKNYSTVAGGFDNEVDSAYATIGGGWDNYVFGHYGTICGGHDNVVIADGAYIGGGSLDTARGEFASVGGGNLNTAGENYATVGGGHVNKANGLSSTISGGSANTASGHYSTICGGRSSTASGDYATVCGGYNNTAEGYYSFAAGNVAHANHLGSFVWSDAEGAPFVTSTGNNQFTVRASGGVRFYTNYSMATGVTLDPGGGSWVSVSDSALKENIRPVDGDEILEKLAELEISRWNYKTQDESIQHIGPMAQDFYRLFGLGSNNTSITTIDPDGIALAAAKQLALENRELKERLKKLEALVAQLIVNE